MKTKWTYQKHVETGRGLSEYRNKLVDFILELSHSYSVNSKAVRLAHKAQKAVDELRCELDDQLCRDYKEFFSPHVYYPNGTPEEITKKAVEGAALAEKADAVN